MRGNRPAREKFEFSLDARQVAAVLLGSFGALAITFYLGYAVGQRIQERGSGRPAQGPAPAVAAPPADPLAALDHPPRPDGGEPPPKLSFHEALTGPRPAAEKIPAPKGAPSPVPTPEAVRAPEPKGAAPASPRPQEARGAEAAPAGAKGGAAPAADPKGVPSPAEAAPAAARPAEAPVPPKAAEPAKGAATSKGSPPRPAAAAPREAVFAIQVGSTQDRFEAERIATRYRARGARVVASDVPGKGRWYRVKVGGYDTREAAEQALRELEKAGSKGFVTTAN
jgi:DedD protein